MGDFGRIGLVNSNNNELLAVDVPRRELGNNRGIVFYLIHRRAHFNVPNTRLQRAIIGGANTEVYNFWSTVCLIGTLALATMQMYQTYQLAIEGENPFPRFAISLITGIGAILTGCCYFRCCRRAP